MHNLKSVLENETHELFCGFEIQTDYIILTRQLQPVIVNKKENLSIMDFTIPADHRVKLKEIENRVKYLDFARELKKTMNMKVAVIPIGIGVLVTTLNA